MNKIQIIISSVFATCIVALFVLVFVFQFGGKKNNTPELVQVDEVLPIAVVNTDSILQHYTLAVESTEQLMTSYENSTVKLDNQARAFQKEYETFQRDVLDFQRKLEANAFLSRERAESEQKRLQNKEQQLLKKQQDLEALRQKLSNDFMEQQNVLNKQLADSVQQFLREYNADGHYHLIVNDAVVMNKVAGYDITNEVIEGLNARYGK